MASLFSLEKPEDKDNAPLIAGIIGGVVFFLIVVVVCYAFAKKRRHSSSGLFLLVYFFRLRLKLFGYIFTNVFESLSGPDIYIFNCF